ncbi:hypothetical protein vBCtySFA88_00042 [Clostridium phage vB_CtyS-FA88]|nr:hypothetical protein vBCtySFA88_00042 [Clostridium phage vB_CtyS-FA88]
MIINDVPVLADVEAIFTELRNQLQLNGIDLLHDIKPTNNNIQFTCIKHAGGHEHKPSCGISEVDVRRGDKVFPAGTVHCFTCGYTASLDIFISDCFGKDDFGSFGFKWLMKNFVSLDIETRKKMDFGFNSRLQDVQAPQPKIKYITEAELETYRFIHPYMYKRKLTDEIIDDFDVGYDKNTRCLTFPVADKNGNILFVYRRSVNSKFFNAIKDTVKSKTIYGIDKIYQNISKISSVIITESIINCLTCWTHGKPAMALLGTGAVNQYKILRELPIRNLTLALDPDEAGMRGTERLYKNLKDCKILSKVAYPKIMYRKKLDLNDISYDDFEKLSTILI